MSIEDIEYVMLRHPDLDAACAFMRDYGLLDLERNEQSAYMRTYGDAPFSWMSTQGEPALVGIGFRVADAAGLENLAARFRASIADCPHPGGGKYVVTEDPDGRRLEFVYGAKRSKPVDAGGKAIVWNDAFGKKRLGHYQRPAAGPAHAMRLGHIALLSPKPQELIAWYCENVGAKPSELIHAGEESNVLASFMHLDRGATWTDHHTVAIVASAAAGKESADVDHISFECRDFDDLGMGHMHMLDCGHKHRWGIGRHFHGSQIFDYWTDPAGFNVEHFTDGDLVNADTPILKYPFGRDTLLQWGPNFPGA